MSWWRNGLDLVGKGANDGGSVDVDFGDDTLYGYYTPSDRAHIGNGKLSTLISDCAVERDPSGRKGRTLSYSSASTKKLSARETPMPLSDYTRPC